ncbi:hypothetical protein HY837_02165, partial [archaeon]|nr:hypothetical protein [archaeon]
IIGLFVTNNYLTKTDGGLFWKPLPSVLGVGVERPELSPKQTVGMVVVAILFGTLIFLGILKFKFFKLMKVWFFLALLLCLHIAFGAFLPSIIAFILALILAYFKLFKNNFYLHNFTELFLYSGLGIIFIPLLTISTSFILLLLISFYDMYAVLKSKHMITLAKAQAENGLFAGLALPYKFPKILQPTQLLLQTQNQKPKTKHSVAILGGGDIGFPIIFSGVAFAVYGFNALIISFLATLALALLFFLAKKNVFYPAMPFISAGCFIGYFILWIFL